MSVVYLNPAGNVIVEGNDETSIIELLSLSRREALELAADLINTAVIGMEREV